MYKKIIGLVLAMVISVASVSPTLAYNEQQETRYGFWDNMTQIFNKSKEELQKLFQDKTPVQVAQDQGISQDDFHNKVRNVRNQRLQQKVESGYLTQEQADERIRMAEERIENCDGTGYQGLSGFGKGESRGRGLHKN